MCGTHLILEHVNRHADFRVGYFLFPFIQVLNSILKCLVISVDVPLGLTTNQHNYFQNISNMFYH